MKTLTLILYAALCHSAQVCTAGGGFTNRFETLTTLDGQEFINVRPQRIEEARLIIFHSTGIARVDVKQLPDAVRLALGLPTVAQERARERERLESQRQQVLLRLAEYAERDAEQAAAKRRILAKYHGRGEFLGYKDPDHLGRDMRILAKRGSQQADAVARELGY